MLSISKPEQLVKKCCVNLDGEFSLPSLHEWAESDRHDLILAKESYDALLVDLMHFWEIQPPNPNI